MKRFILFFVMASLIVAGCSKNAATLDALRQKRAEAVAKACVTYLVDHGSFPKQLADLLPSNAPKGDCFAGFTPEQTIQGYDYFGNGAPSGETTGAIIGGAVWVSSHPVKTSDQPTTVILRASEPLSDGRKILVTLGGGVVLQPAK